MPPAVNMSPIMEALARRRAGAVGGGAIPAQQQISAPSGPGPVGGPSTPIPAAPQQGTPRVGGMPNQVDAGGAQATNGALKAAGAATGPSFDPETRELAKALMAKLVKGL